MNLTGARYLSALATELTGRKTTVRVDRNLPDSVLGYATHDGEQFVITVNPKLLRPDKKADLAYLFRHECAHICLGHVPERKTATQMDTFRREVGRNITNAAWMASKTYEREESQADTWANEHAKIAPPWRIWNLVTGE